MRKNVDHINGEKFEDSSHKQKFINMMVDVDIKNTDIKLNIVNPTFGKYEEKIHGVFKGTKYGFSEGNYNKNMSEIHKLTLTDKTHRKTDNIEVSDLWDKKNKIHYHVKQIKGDLRVLALQIYNSIKYLTIEVNHTNDFVIKHELAITRDFQVKYVAVVILGEKNTEIKGFKNNWALDLIQKICTTNDIQFEVHVIKYVKHDQLITNI
jgi:hypothetical protein